MPRARCAGSTSSLQRRSLHFQWFAPCSKHTASYILNQDMPPSIMVCPRYTHFPRRKQSHTASLLLCLSTLAQSARQYQGSPSRHRFADSHRIRRHDSRSALVHTDRRRPRGPTDSRRARGSGCFWHYFRRCSAGPGPGWIRCLWRGGQFRLAPREPPRPTAVAQLTCVLGMMYNTIIATVAF